MHAEPGRLVRIWLIALTCAAIAIASTDAGAAPRAHVRATRVAPGLRYSSYRFDLRGSVRAYVLRIRLGSPVSLDVALGDRSFPSYSATVPDMAAANHALAAVNGDFGGWSPVHAFADDGMLIRTAVQPGNVIAFGPDHAAIGRPRIRVAATATDGVAMPVAAWNASGPRGDDVVGFSPVGGTEEGPPPRSCAVRLLPNEVEPADPAARSFVRTTAVDEVACSATPMKVAGGIVLVARPGGVGADWIRSLHAGERVSLSWSSGFQGAGDVQGGLPLLVDRGRVAVRTPCTAPLCPLQPRTGVGVSRGCVDDSVSTPCFEFLVVVDGRRWSWSVGLTMVDFARFMRRLGAWQALNLDGGGSSTMVVRGNVVNQPAEGLRPVPSSFLVLSGRDPGEVGLWFHVLAPRAISAWRMRPRMVA